MDATSIQHRVRQCSKCPGNTEYFCETCTFNLCKKCSWNHVPYPKILYHDVGIYRARGKFNYIPKQVIYVRDPVRVNVNCELCELPVCYHSTKHRNHEQDFLLIYKTKQRTFNIIRTESLLYVPILLGEIKADVKGCRTKFSLYYSNMLKRSKFSNI